MTCPELNIAVDVEVTKQGLPQAIEFLNLFDTQVTDMSIDSILKSPSLKNVVLERTRVSAQGKRRIREAGIGNAWIS